MQSPTSYRLTMHESGRSAAEMTPRAWLGLGLGLGLGVGLG